MTKDLHNPPPGLPPGPVVEKEVAINNAADQGWFCLFFFCAASFVSAFSAFFLFFSAFQPLNCVRASTAPEVGAEGESQWADVGRHLREVNVLRGAGFSGGTDAGAPEADHRLRWAADAPLKYVFDLAETPEDPHSGLRVARKASDGIHNHNVMYPMKKSFTGAGGSRQGFRQSSGLTNCLFIATSCG